MKLFKYFLSKCIPALVLILTFSTKSMASHIRGGEIFYSYIGPGANPNTSKYSISLRLFRDCNQVCGGNTGVACLPVSATISIFSNAAGFPRIADQKVNRTTINQITLTTYPACISTKPPVCYEIGTYTFTAELADNQEGYRFVYQTCCREFTENLKEIDATLSGASGTTYECISPGKLLLPTGTNSSAVFKIKDTALVCYNVQFSLDFSATDADNDILTYEFQSAYNGGTFTSSADAPSGKPPYGFVNYENGYNGTSPLGPNVKLDQNTGIISGISPSVVGDYVVCVLVKEWRNGVVIGQHRKDFNLVVNDCSIPSISLQSEFITCNGFDLTFTINSASNLVNSYYWDFGVPGIDNDTAITKTAKYSFTDTGVYKVTIIANRGQQCTDSAETEAKVYPGFIPDFSFSTSCIQNPFSFTDLTQTAYGNTNSWKWNFGELTTLGDTSYLQNPNYLYPTTGNKTVKLVVTNSKGCIDSLTKNFDVNLGPDLLLKFRDTLICKSDTLQLLTSTTAANAKITWSPGYNLISQGITTPLVYPYKDTTYFINILDNGCIANDSIKVRVADSVFLALNNDTTLCRGDTLQLNSTSNALTFLWSPSVSISNTQISNPYTIPLTDIKYILTAGIGKCQVKDSINIKSIPYPKADAGLDKNICFGKTIQLSASTLAANFKWTPTNTLLNSNTLNPTAGPQTSTTYAFTVTDTLGCPKPFTDSIKVFVTQPFKPNAGVDRNVVINQPIQLNASDIGANATYLWSPALYLNNPNIQNPIATFPKGADTVTYLLKATSDAGCVGFDTVNYYVFETIPEIFVPSGFTPNGDGMNDILKPILAGLKELTNFNVYNRWGNLVFSTNEENTGWDGTFKGNQQAAGTYVFIARAIDFSDRILEKRGTVVLIR